MVRVLRYPRLCFTACLSAILCAAARDLCVNSAGLRQTLLYVTFLLLPVCFVLISCRFTVDAQGIGVGFLFRMRHTLWQDVASLGVLCVNTRRLYLYGMYRSQTDFLNMLHHAPVCGPWGFVVPMSEKVKEALEIYCPFKVNLSAPTYLSPSRSIRRQWKRALLSALYLLPLGLLTAASGVMMILRTAAYFPISFVVLLTALLLIFLGVLLLRRSINIFMICPGYNEEGVCAGRSAYLPWENVRFAYVHRIARMSTLYLLSRPHSEMLDRGALPVMCLSLPDTSTLLLAYLTCCPHADKDIGR